MNNFIYKIRSISSALQVGKQKVIPMETKCFICNKRINNYIDYYTVEQKLKGTDWACYPYRDVCSEQCANMLILGSLDEGISWTKNLKGSWKIVTPVKVQTVFGIDPEEALIETIANEIRIATDSQIIEDLRKIAEKSIAKTSK